MRTLPACLAIAAASLALAGCQSPGERALAGGLIGGGAGAGVGYAVGGMDGALVGGGIGAVGGAIVGAATGGSEAYPYGDRPYHGRIAYGDGTYYDQRPRTYRTRLPAEQPRAAPRPRGHAFGYQGQ